MSSYTAITILYNPHSSGSSKQLARELKRELLARAPNLNVSVTATKHAGHGEKLAYKLALASERPLIIAASGDGGYHEVINGAMRAQAEGATPTTGLLPAGNANDHYKALHEHDMVGAIMRGKAKSIDLLKFSYDTRAGRHESYAHSYIGLGMTSHAGRVLNRQTSRNWLKDIVLVGRVILFSGPVTLRVDGKQRKYDSLIFSNIGKMSKILSLSHIAAPDDGRFEITAARHRMKLSFIAHLAKASTRGLQGRRQAKSFTFTTVRTTLVQLDGEIMSLKADITASVTTAPKVLRCII